MGSKTRVRSSLTSLLFLAQDPSVLGNMFHYSVFLYEHLFGLQLVIPSVSLNHTSEAGIPH